MSFQTRAIYNWKMDRQYRVIPVGRELFFIKTGGQFLTSQLLGQHLGLLGVLIMHLMKKRTARKEAEKLKAMEGKSPEQLLTEHKHNFRLSTDQIKGASLTKAPFIKLHGHCVARLNIEVVGGEPFTLQFDTNEAALEALTVLPTMLGERLRVRLKWDAAKKKFLA